HGGARRADGGRDLGLHLGGAGGRLGRPGGGGGGDPGRLAGRGRHRRVRGRGGPDRAVGRDPGPGAGFVSALLGGAFIPLGQLPPLLAALGLLTPLGQALRAFALLSAGDATLADVLPWVAALLAWALATGLVAARLLPVRLGSR